MTPAKPSSPRSRPYDPYGVKAAEADLKDARERLGSMEAQSAAAHEAHSVLEERFFEAMEHARTEHRMAERALLKAREAERVGRESAARERRRVVVVDVPTEPAALPKPESSNGRHEGDL